MSIAHLFSARSAVFLKPDPKRPLSKAAIEDLVRAAASSRSGQYVERIIRRKHVVSGHSVRFTYACFRVVSEPPFLRLSGLQDSRYAFLLIVEAPHVVGVFSRHIPGISKTIASLGERWDYKDLGGIFADDQLAYERLSLRGMSLARNAIRRRNIEAEDLTEAMAVAGLHRSIPSSFRTRGSRGVHSISPSAGRISRKDTRAPLDDLLKWVCDIGVALKTSASHYPQTFLAQFCREIPFEDLPADAEPNAILFDFSQLRSEWEDAQNSVSLSLAYSPRSQKSRPLSEASILSFFDNARNVLLVEDDKIVYESQKGKKHVVGKIRRHKRTIDITSNLLERIRVRRMDQEVSLRAYLSAEKCFVVTFTRPEFCYADRVLFEDSALLTSIDELLRLFEARSELSLVTEEKAVKSTESKVVKSTEFGISGIFRFVEDSLVAKNAVLVCDDLGDEWADFISIDDCPSDPILSFLHCKHGEASSGASALQEPIGQATKNLSRMYRDLSAFQAKLSGSWSRDYPGTKIPRVRRGGSLDQVEARFASAIGSARLHRFVVLVLSGLSLKQVNDEFDELILGIARPHVSQLLWILSSFWATCREHGVRVRIFCQP